MASHQPVSSLPGEEAVNFVALFETLPVNFVRDVSRELADVYYVVLFVVLQDSTGIVWLSSSRWIEDCSI